MKRIILSIIGLAMYTTSFSQMNAENATIIKNSIFSIELTGNSTLDSNIVKTIDNYWSFTEKYTFIGPLHFGDKTPKMNFTIRSLIWKTGYRSASGTVYHKEKIGEASTMSIRTKTGRMHVGFNRLSNLTYPDFVESIKRAQFLLSEIIIEGAWGDAISSLKKKYGKELKNKILLVDKQLLKEKLDLETFTSIYPYNFKFVDKKEVDEAILKNDSSKAYIITAEEQVGIFVQLICDAETGKIYTHRHSVIQTKSSMKNKTFNQSISVSDLKKLSKRIK